MTITPVKTLVERAKKEIETIPLDECATLLAADNILLVDIRDIRELGREGKIPGAIHAPRGMLEFWVDPTSPYHREEFATDKKIVLFCAGAWRSALAAKTLQDMGLNNIAEMDGGFGKWKEAEHPVTIS
ncbi:rhodanese-like domain-containing protein [Cochlodiniinecator piscidefendens]|uniref:rhodanese-like domain-containing protein n=1 Tax=Cochlodiniinecator piscidefendens TaxID=2715756 RepID=UPI00140762DE|nr:rhodanese-like domain-containing protein [Cochlodiniinecator piscidefendens]